MTIDARNLATVRKMWRREVEAAATYRHLAGRERDPKRRDILTRLADQEDGHAARWSERIARATGTVPDPREVEHGLTWFQRISDPNVVLHRLEQEENRAEAEYDELLARLSDPEDRRIAEEAMVEERDHAVVLGKGQNRRFLENLNREHGWFGEIHALEHPRSIMQYRRKQLQAHVDEYVRLFSRLAHA